MFHFFSLLSNDFFTPFLPGSLRTLGRFGRCFFFSSFDGLPLLFGRGFLLASEASVASERPRIKFLIVTILVLLRSGAFPNVTAMLALRSVAVTSRNRLLNRVASFGQSFCLDTFC